MTRALVMQKSYRGLRNQLYLILSSVDQLPDENYNECNIRIVYKFTVAVYGRENLKETKWHF